MLEVYFLSDQKCCTLSILLKVYLKYTAFLQGSGDSYESSFIDDSELDHDAFYFNDQDNKTFQ